MMETIIFTILILIWAAYKWNSQLAIENLALRQQLAIMKQSVKRPKIRKRDRIFWSLLSRFWKDWKDALIVVKLETVIRWHRKGFKLFWTFKSRKKGPGRPSIDPETRKLIVDIAKANPLWGAPRIHGELLKLEIDVSERTVSNIIRNPTPTQPTLSTSRIIQKFIDNYSEF